MFFNRWLMLDPKRSWERLQQFLTSHLKIIANDREQQFWDQNPPKVPFNFLPTAANLPWEDDFSLQPWEIHSYSCNSTKNEKGFPSGCVKLEISTSRSERITVKQQIERNRRKRLTWKSGNGGKWNLQTIWRQNDNLQ